MPQCIPQALIALLTEGGVLYAAAFALLALPAAVFLAAFVLAACLPRVRRSAFGWFLFFCDFCECAFAALFLLGEGGRQALIEGLILVLAVKALYLALYGALFLPRAFAALRAHARARKKKALAVRFAPSDAKEQSLPAAQAPFAPAAPAFPPKVRCFGEETGGVQVERDVRLGHISAALRRLQQAPLSAGDRLETQAAEDLLQVYAGKGNLRSEEAESLNDVMASLLKMMARYDL